MISSRISAILDPQTKKIIVQTPLPPINCLAFEGGGLRCTAYAGSYKVLYNTGLIDEVCYVSGSSGGAICASGVALGFDPDEIKSIMLSIDLSEFLEESRSALSATGWYSRGKTLLSIFRSEKYSLSTGNKFLEWLRLKIETKFGKKQVTFADLANKVKAADNHGKYKYLYVTGTNLSLELPECKYFSHETTPDMEIALAVYISALIPLVFSLKEYDGSMWGDGGLIRNLPTTIFDDRKYLPDGYDFNDKGKNPGVLAIKVDSKSEINQVLYGVVKKVDLTSAGNVANALYNALTQNTDTDEIRASRLTLALQDNNVGALEFTVDTNGKIGLISTGEKETLNFVEDYYNTAYCVKTYDTATAWLNDLTIDQIDDMIAIYEAMLNHKYAGEIHIVDDKSKKIIVDLDQAASDTINKYILFLENYIDYKRKLKRNPEHKMNFTLPDFHINIPPACHADTWSEHVEDEMNERLKHISQQINYLNIKINSMCMEFSDMPVIDKMTLLHHQFYFDNVQALANFIENQKLLYAEKNELREKLGYPHQKHKKRSEQEIKTYANFSHILKPLLSSSSIPQDLATIMPDTVPIFKFEAYRGVEEAYSDFDRTIFNLDLRNETDRKIYIVTAMLYLTHIQSDNKDFMLKLYREFVSERFPVPQNMKELADVFQTSTIDLLVTAYRIEALLHCFERKANPEIKKGLINLDAFFGADKFYKFHTTEKIDIKRDVPMKHIIHSNSIFSYNSISSRSCSPSQSAPMSQFFSDSALSRFYLPGNKDTADEKSEKISSGKKLQCSDNASNSESDLSDYGLDAEEYERPYWFG